MSTIKRCSFCTLLGRLMRRVTCVGSRRGSSESYYRELGDQDTLKIDGSQASSDESTEMNVDLPINGCDHDDEALETEEIEVSADAHGGASTSTAHPYEDPEAPRAQAQGPVEHVQINASEAVDVTEPVAVPGTSSQALLSKNTEAIVEAGPSGYAQAGPSGEGSSRVRLTGRFQSIHRRRSRHVLASFYLEDSGLIDDLMMGPVRCCLNQSAVWTFNAFILDSVSGGRGLPMLCIHLFHAYKLVQYFNLDVLKLWRLFSLIEQNYHSTNPYHNSIHAADVTQAMHCFLRQQQVSEYMEPIEIMAALLAAIAHDLDHPGVNQSFLVATDSHLVSLYQSKSVLENHHWRAAISCLLESELLDDIPMYREQLEAHVRALILATDITRQQDYLGHFKAYLDSNTLDMKRPDHRLLVLQIALKCADISNPCRPWDISYTWSMKVCEEFFRQGDIERHLNLPLTPLCDRNANTVPKIQSGFFKYVVTPLITEWHMFLKNDLSAEMLKNLVGNHKKWDLLILKAATLTDDEGVVDDRLRNDALYVHHRNNSAAVRKNLAESGVNLSGSTKVLLLSWPRRSSLTPPLARPAGLGEQQRRFSVPLNVDQDSLRNNDQGQDVAGALAPEEQCLDGAPVHGGLQDKHQFEEVLSCKKLSPESTEASIITPEQAMKISEMLGENNLKTVTSRTQSLIPRASSHDASIYQHAAKSDSGIRFDAKAEEKPRNDNQKAGNQLRENLVAWHRDFDRRRKSVPTETMNEAASRERRFRELREVLPQLIARTLSPSHSGRRGSAPVAGAAEPRPPVTRQGSTNGSRAARVVPGTRAVQEPRPDLPRRSSLPVEAFRLTEELSPTE